MTYETVDLSDIAERLKAYTDGEDLGLAKVQTDIIILLKTTGVTRDQFLAEAAYMWDDISVDAVQ